MVNNTYTSAYVERGIRNRFIPDFRIDSVPYSGVWVLIRNRQYTTKARADKYENRLYIYPSDVVDNAHCVVLSGRTIRERDTTPLKIILDLFEQQTAPRLADDVRVVLRRGRPAIHPGRGRTVFFLPNLLEGLAREFLCGKLEGELLLDAIKHDTEIPV